MVGTCKLCLQSKTLIKKSHIIPDFIFRESNLYDHKHKLLSIDLFEFLSTGKVTLISQNQKSADYEKHILCANCDGDIIGKYESYVRELFFADKIPINKNITGLLQL